MGGLLSQLVGIKAQKEQRAFQDQMGIYKSVYEKAINDPDSVQPGTLEAAANAIGQLADSQLGHKGKAGGAGGQKGGGIGDLFKGMLTMGAYNIYKGKKESDQTTQDAVEKSRGTMQGKMSLTPEERAEVKRKQEEAQTKILVERNTAIEKGKKEADLQLESDPKYHNTLMELRKRDAKEAGVVEGTPEFQRFMLTGTLPNTSAATRRPSARKQTEVTGPDGKKFTAFVGMDESGTEQLYKLGSNEPLDPSKYTQVEKPPAGEMGAEEKSRLWAENHKNDPDPATAKTAKDTLKHLDAVSSGAGLQNVIRLEQLPGSGGSPSLQSSPDQTPISRLNKVQRRRVEDAMNMLASGTSLGFGQAARTQMNEAKRLIEETTGLSPEEIDFRFERRKSAKKAYDKIKTLEASSEGLSNALDRAGTILTNLRPQLPSSDITKINEWLQSGAREFNVGGVSKAAIQYGLALNAVRNEYARVISGGAASAGQTPVEALKSAGEKMSGGFTTGNTKAMVDQLRQEAKQSIGGRQQELQNLSKEISQSAIPELYGKKYEPVETTSPPGGSSSSEDKEYNGHTYHRDKAGEPWKLVK